MKRLPLILLVSAATSAALAAPVDDLRWGAIALGGDGFGATRGRVSEAAATAGALRQCEESGGAGECRIRLTYRNQCAAYAAGDDRQVGVAFADSIGKASRLAQRSCAKSARNCQVHYAACSLPSSFN
ncbi:MAG: DUF4189 domain-containing protein [Sphingomonadales bacterium]|nr:DUF4189 domain-containing protein [Sphingomonadales bacterium]MBD3771955.1 DUF4189 domain-containing protein [Paracoccaceae bacterium]